MIKGIRREGGNAITTVSSAGTPILWCFKGHLDPP
jgi:hypothetical protein